MIGFPDFILDNKELDDVYDGVGGSKPCRTPVGQLWGGDRAPNGATWAPSSTLHGRTHPHLPSPPQYEVSEDSFFQNMLNFYNFSAKVMADQLRKPPNRDQ